MTDKKTLEECKQVWNEAYRTWEATWNITGQEESGDSAAINVLLEARKKWEIAVRKKTREDIAKEAGKELRED